MGVLVARHAGWPVGGADGLVMAALVRWRG